MAEIAELYIILENPFSLENGLYSFDDYLSDDGFLYFRSWILLKGEYFFKDITTDIQSFVSGNYSFNIANGWAEGLLYVPDAAYSINHDNQEDCEIADAVSELYPEVLHFDSMELEMEREPKSDTELQKMYPKLVNEICKLRSL